MIFELLLLGEQSPMTIAFLVYSDGSTSWWPFVGALIGLCLIGVALMLQERRFRDAYRGPYRRRR